MLYIKSGVSPVVCTGTGGMGGSLAELDPILFSPAAETTPFVPSTDPPVELDFLIDFASCCELE